MGKFIDETGKRYGKLLVIRRVPNHPGSLSARFLCRCDCGNELEVDGGDLRRAHTHSCSLGFCHHGALPRGEAAFTDLYHNRRRGAIKRSLEWSLTKMQFRDLSIMPCYYCGKEPSQTWADHHRINKRTGIAIYNGIDRMDNLLGYTIANCVPCCWRCNQAKRDMSLEEFSGWILSVSETALSLKTNLDLVKVMRT